MKVRLDQRGFLTLDFVFAVVLIFTFTAVLFVMTLTLTAASITQYITFASARNFVTSHQNQDTQKERAIAKYKQLTTNKVFAPLYKNTWFQISSDPFVGDASTMIQGYQSTGTDPSLFWGVNTSFTARILDFNVPGFGATNPNDAGNPDTFKTTIGSYLGRDNSVDECMALVKQRWSAIQGLNSSYSTASGTYVVIADDGC